MTEPSVTNLIPEIRRHGGLIEPILIRLDKMDVIEGNSRLAVYKHLKTQRREGEWDYIPCNMISSLTDAQQAAFLNQIHVKGKTQWSAYEKANFAYVRHSQGWDAEQIAKLFGESESTIRMRIRVIELMRKNTDGDLSHFSHYNVLVRTQGALTALTERPELNKRLMNDLRTQGSDQTELPATYVTAQELRRTLPALLVKRKVLNRYIKGTVGLRAAFQQAEISPLEEKVKQATSLIDDITKTEVLELERDRFLALRQQVNKLARVTTRTVQLLDAVEPR